MPMWIYFPLHKSVQKCNVLSSSCLEETGIAIATRLGGSLEEQQLNVVVMQCLYATCWGSQKVEENGYLSSKRSKHQ